MTSPVPPRFARRLLGTPGSTQLDDGPFIGAFMTAWNPTTFANTVNVGGTVTYTNLAVINPAALSVGPVLLANGRGAPIVLGRLYRAA